MKKIIAIALVLVMSLGLLCIGASAADYDYVTVTGTMNGWNPASENDRMTKVSDGVYTITYTDMAAGDYEFKFTANGNWSDLDLGGAYMGSGVESSLTWGGANIKLSLTEAETVKIDLDINNYKFTITVGNEVAEAPADITIHIVVPENWGTVYAYCWNPDSLGSWPGTAVENGQVTLAAVFDGFIINNGEGTQTVDICDIDLTKEAVWVTLNDTANEDGKYGYTLSYEAPAEETPAVPTIADGKYVISYGELTFAALAEEKTYGYAPAGDLNNLTDADYVTITNVDGGFTMQDCYGRYIYMTGTYNNFNVNTEAPTEGHIWTLVEVEDGYYIQNVLKEKHISYSASYGTWGSYASAGDNSVLTITAVVEEETPVEPTYITVHVTADHWTNIYGYVWAPEALGTWPGTLAENGSFVVAAGFEGMVLSNGEGTQTPDIKDIDQTKTEVWITVNADNTYTLSYEAPVVDPGTNPEGPTTGDNILPGVLVALLSVTGLVTVISKKRF